MPDHTADYDDGEQFHFRDIRPGDIVHDLGQMGWPKMRVLRKEAPSVADYIDSRDQDLRQYEKNALAGADLDDQVFLVTFLTDSPYNAAKTHYPVPASRLAKQDLDSEAAHIADDHDPVFHPYDQAVLEFLTAVLTTLKDDGQTDRAHQFKGVAHTVLGNPVLTDMADDISQAQADIPSDVDPAETQATDGGEDADDADASDDELGDFESYDG